MLRKGPYFPPIERESVDWSPLQMRLALAVQEPGADLRWHTNYGYKSTLVNDLGRSMSEPHVGEQDTARARLRTERQSARPSRNLVPIHAARRGHPVDFQGFVSSKFRA